MAYKTNFISHVRTMSHCLHMFNVKGKFNIENYHMELWGRGRHSDLIPLFVAMREGRLRYGPRCLPGLGFVSTKQAIIIKLKAVLWSWIRLIDRLNVGTLR